MQYDSWAALAPFTRTTPDKDTLWVRGALGLDGPLAAAGRGRSAGRGPSLHCYFQTRKRNSNEGFWTWRNEPVEAKPQYRHILY